MTSDNNNPTSGTVSNRTPVYFLGIGGPNFMENREHPAYAKMGLVGKEITERVRPKAVVVFSAHWQAGPSKVQINVGENVPQIYDFYGFPPHYYEYKFPNKGSKELAEQVIQRFTSAGIEVERVNRGLDHGVWAGFIVAFDPKKNPLDVPIVQVSLYANEDLAAHYRLGEVLSDLRDQGVLIVGAGMAVHNLMDFRRSMGKKSVMPYATTFEKALGNAVTTAPEKRRAELLALQERADFRQAHPTLDHVLPVYVAAGAAASDAGERVFEMPEMSLNWASYRFGAVPAAS